jgi:repressor LexA
MRDKSEYQNQFEIQKQKLLSFYKSYKRMPSYAELMKILGYKTKSAVHYFAQKLIESGIVAKDQTGRLIPKNIFGETKVLGIVEAGFPSAAEEELIDTMSLDDYLIRNKEATYILKVKGDSMIDAGIQEGDMVLVERGRTPKPGDIVIANVDGEYTMKYYRRRGDKVFLEAANIKYKPIIPKAELKIDAVVKGVIRRY